jgi:hypothetical protein
MSRDLAGRCSVAGPEGTKTGRRLLIRHVAERSQQTRERRAAWAIRDADRHTRRETQIVPRKQCTARPDATRSTRASADTSESRRIVGNA